MYAESIKKIEGHFWYSVHPIPSIHPIRKHDFVFSNFEPQKKVFWDFTKNGWILKTTGDDRIKKWQVWTQKSQKSPTCCIFAIHAPPSPTWNQILKPIRMLVTIFYYLYKYSKIVTKILMGFKIWCQVGEWGSWISKIP